MTTSNRILSIVDDEMDVTVLFRDALCRIPGLTVLAFNDPTEALKHYTINQEEYVLVISDYKMPVLNGLDLLRKVKTLNPNVRTMIMSAFDVDGDHLLQKYLIEEIIDKFIQKPITMLNLYNEVQSQVSAYGLSLR
ncbi:MAG TPA: response regulator [Nitrososphaeraceae archaeon]|nr:response regulator [Nitrososphaeraceae archaeon]